MNNVPSAVIVFVLIVFDGGEKGSNCPRKTMLWQQESIRHRSQMKSEKIEHKFKLNNH